MGFSYNDDWWVSAIHDNMVMECEVMSKIIEYPPFDYEVENDRKYKAVMDLINRTKGEPQFIEMLYYFFWPEEEE